MQGFRRGRFARLSIIVVAVSVLLTHTLVAGPDPDKDPASTQNPAPATNPAPAAPAPQPAPPFNGPGFQAAWAKLKATIRDPKLDYPEKSAAVDDLFKALNPICAGACTKAGQILNLLPAEVGQFAANIPRVGALAEIVQTHVTDGNASAAARKAQAVLNLFRSIAKLEEEKVFDLLTTNQSPSARIHATAQLTEDASYLVRQGLALVKLARSFNGMAKDITKAGSAALGAGDSVSVKDLAGTLTTTTQDSFEKILPQIINSVQDLGVYYLKLAQTFGAVASAASPESYQKVEQFQNQVATKMPYTTVRKIIEKDLGGKLEDHFVEFEREPFASASIAQIHRAKIRLPNGQIKNVVVKVKKEHVEKELKWNIAINNIFLDWLQDQVGDGMAKFALEILGEQAHALGDSFVGELDFPAEARRMIRHRRLFSWTRGIEIPETYLSHSGASTITMEEITGVEKLGTGLPALLEKITKDGLFDTHSDTPDTLADLKLPVKTKDEKKEGKVETPATETHGAPVTSELENVVDKAVAEVETGNQPSLFKEIKDLYVKLKKEHGFKMGAQYMQLFRALAPPFGVASAYYRARAAMDKDGGIDSLAPEDRVAWKMLERRYANLERVIFDSLLHLGEIHSDLQPGNVQQRKEGSNIVLFDWGQTVKSAGHLLNPFRLTWNILTGDAKGTARAVARLGTMNAGDSYETLIPIIQDIFDRWGVKKRSTFSLVMGRFFGRKSASPPVEVVEAKSKPATETKPASETKPEPTDKTVAEKPAVETTTKEEVSLDRATAKTPQPDFKAVGALGKSLFRAMLRFPLDRLKYRTLGAYDDVREFCRRNFASLPKRN